MLSFVPFAVSQSFIGEVAFRLDTMMHVVQGEMEDLETSTINGERGMDRYSFVVLISRLLMEHEEKQQILQRISRSEDVTVAAGSTLTQSPSDTMDAAPPIMTRRKSLNLAQQRRRSTANLTDSLAEFAAGRRRASDARNNDSVSVVANASVEGESSTVLHHQLDVDIWAVEMEQVHSQIRSDSTATNASKVECFTKRAQLQYCLCSTFDQIIKSATGGTDPTRDRVKFGDVRTFVLDVLLSKKGLSTSDGTKGKGDNPCALTVVKSVECRALYHAEKLELIYVEDRDSTGKLRKKVMLAGTFRITGEVPATIRVVNVNSPAEVEMERILQPEEGNITSLCSVSVTSINNRGTFKLLLVGTADGGLRAYEVPTGLKRKKVDILMKAPIMIMGTVDQKQLFCGDAKGTLFILQLPEATKHIALPEACLTSIHAILEATFPNVHKGPFTAFAADAERQLLFTAGLDHRIVQFDLRTLGIVRSFSGHRQAVLALAFSSKENVLISAGTEYKVYCWPLEMVDCVPQVLATPMKRGTTALQIVPGAPVALSLDARGTFTVWNLRLYSWQGFMYCDPDVGGKDERGANVSWTTFVIDPHTKDIVCHANRKVYTLQYDAFQAALHPLSAHEGAVAHGVCWDTESKLLVSAAQTQVALWNVETARSRHVVPNATTGTIHSILLLQEEGVLVVGLEEGRIVFLTTSTFRQISDYSSTSTEAIVTLVRAETVGSCAVAIRSANGMVELVVLDTDTNECRALPLRRKDGILKATAIDSLRVGKREVLLVGEPGNSVSVWSLQKKKQSTIFIDNEPQRNDNGSLGALNPIDIYTASSFPASEETSSVLGVRGHGMFIAGDTSGRVHLWGFENAVAWPLAHFFCRRYNALLRSSVVTAMMYHEETDLLYIGDSTGSMTCFVLDHCIPATSIYSVESLTASSRREGTDSGGIFMSSGSFAKSATMLSDGKQRKQRPPPKGSIVPLCSSEVKLLCSWDAHPEASVQQVIMIPGPYVLVTVSSECQIQLWHLGGSPIGALVSPNNVLAGGDAADQRGIDLSFDGVAAKVSSKKIEGRKSVVPVLGEGEVFTIGRAKRKQSSAQLVSFLTEFSFGQDGDGGGGGVEDKHRSPSASREDVADVDSDGDDDEEKENDARQQFLNRYNDLPYPYGNAEVANRKNTMIMMKSLIRDTGIRLDDSGNNSNASPVDNDDSDSDGDTGHTDAPFASLLKSLSVVHLEVAPIVPEGTLGSPKKPLPASLSLNELRQLVKKKTRKEDAREAKEKVVAPVRSGSPPGAMPLPLDVPPYMSRKMLQRVDLRPQECSYAPSRNIDQTTYGSATDFASYCREALNKAQKAEKIFFEAKQRQGAEDRQLAQPGHASMLGGRVSVSLAHRRGPTPSPAPHASNSLKINIEMEEVIRSRHLPSSMFPSSQRHLQANPVQLPPIQSTPATQSSSKGLDRDGHPDWASELHSTDLDHRCAVVVQEKQFQTMGEETIRLYHKELYRPVKMPDIKRGGMFVSSRSVDESLLPGIAVSSSEGISGDVNFAMNDGLLPSSRLLVATLKKAKADVTPTKLSGKRL